jgi:hypothetical protein
MEVSDGNRVRSRAKGVRHLGVRVSVCLCALVACVSLSLSVVCVSQCLSISDLVFCDGALLWYQIFSCVSLGQWKNNRMHGCGRFVSADGDRYEGGFARGKRHGEGRYVYVNGDTLIGRWKNGKEVDVAEEEKVGEVESGEDETHGETKKDETREKSEKSEKSETKQ